MAFGTLGDLNSYRGSAKPNLPQWLLDQMSANTTVDEGGGQRTEYSFNDNALGGFKRDGKNYVQVGQNKLKDPSKVLSDPELGDYTEASNVIDLSPQGPNYGMLAAVIGAGLLGPALGLGANAAGGAGAASAGGLSTIDTGLSGLFAGTPTLAPATAQYAAAGAFGGAGAGGLSTLNTGLSGLFQGAPTVAPATADYAAAGAFNGSGLLPGAGAGGGATGSGNSLLGQAGNWIASNPMNAAKLGLGLYSMATANQGNVSPGGQGGSVADGPIPSFHPDINSPFKQNPYLQQMMFNVPFMGGSMPMGMMGGK